MHLVAVRRVAKDPLVAKRSNERWLMGLFQLPRLEWEPTGAFLGFPTASHITNHLALTHGRIRIPTSLQRSEERHLMGVIRTSWHVVSSVRA
jgi:hypothetical protein